MVRSEKVERKIQSSDQKRNDHMIPVAFPSSRDHPGAVKDIDSRNLLGSSSSKVPLEGLLFFPSLSFARGRHLSPQCRHQ
jgi:hypothetical protein